ncbi:hypothetical protein KFE25_010263 [Diacronema lutheri]|uniref:Uncharacterized protein n=1 Tax=Diacronema lutheri TaxID=2081491 RepID=A0A8J5XL36_DIALT|nr:hypothetical protein KFE25_010263 [Diacronema lutheri]
MSAGQETTRLILRWPTVHARAPSARSLKHDAGAPHDVEAWMSAPRAGPPLAARAVRLPTAAQERRCRKLEAERHQRRLALEAEQRSRALVFQRRHSGAITVSAAQRPETLGVVLRSFADAGRPRSAERASRAVSGASAYERAARRIQRAWRCKRSRRLVRRERRWLLIRGAQEQLVLRPRPVWHAQLRTESFARRRARDAASMPVLLTAREVAQLQRPSLPSDVLQVRRATLGRGHAHAWRA